MLGLVLSCCLSIQAAAFRNLDFESATTNNLVPIQTQPYLSGGGLMQDLLPGWGLLLGTNQFSMISLNFLVRDLGVMSVISKEALVDPQFANVFPLGFEGSYAFAVNADWSPFFLSQTGDVPVDSRLITIKGFGTDGTRTEVRLNGVVVPLSGFPVMGAGWFTNLTGDISAFAGQTAELEIRMYLERSSSLGHSVGLDTISFAPAPSLSISPSTNQVALRWTVSLSGFTLEASNALSPAASWQAVTNRVTVVGDQYSVTVNSDGDARFYRLRFAPAPGG